MVKLWIRLPLAFSLLTKSFVLFKIVLEVHMVLIPSSENEIILSKETKLIETLLITVI